MAPAEQQDLLAALDVFLSLPLYLAKQGFKSTRLTGAAPGMAQYFPRGISRHDGGHQPATSTVLAERRVCLAALTPHQGCLHRLPLTLRSPIILESRHHGESGALPFAYSASCQGAQALPKDVILFLQVIKPFTLEAAPSLQLSHAWHAAIPGLKTCVHWMQIKGSF